MDMLDLLARALTLQHCSTGLLNRVKDNKTLVCWPLVGPQVLDGSLTAYLVARGKADEAPPRHGQLCATAADHLAHDMVAHRRVFAMHATMLARR